MLVASFGDDVFEGVAGKIAAHLGGSEAKGAVDEFRRRASDVRTDQAVWRRPERVIGRKRLGIGDVEGGAKLMRLKRLHQSIGIDNGPASRVDE